LQLWPGPAGQSPRQPEKENPVQIDTYFTPPPGIAPRICAALDAAKTQIRAWIYTFSEACIAEALVRAKLRGVDVAIVVDISNQQKKNPHVNALHAAGIIVLV